MNGWDVLIDNNTKASVGGGLNLTLQPLTLQLLYFGGPELAGDDPPWRHFFDVVATLKVASSLTLGAHFDYAAEDDVHWYGAAGYATIAVSDPTALGLRAELFADPDGAKTTVVGGQTLSEITGTYTWKFNANLAGRIELRWDHSSKDVFVTHDGSSTSSQVTLAANYLGMF